MKMLALPLLLAACAATGTAVQVVPEGPARIGQTVYVGGPTVRPMAVIQDSRCPPDVTCVWAGTLVLRAEIGTGKGKRRMDLTLGEPVHVADGELTLTEVTGEDRTKPGDYRFTFKFAGGL